MNKTLTTLLDTLKLPGEGRYVNHFYVITLADSDEYAKVYTLLDDKTTNTGYPNFGVNTNNTTTKITNYFEISQDGIDYNIFLIADFAEDSYKVKIGEK